MKSKLWFRLLLVALGITVLFFAFTLLPLSLWINNLLAWVETLGPIAPVIFVLIYIVACVLLLPGSMLTLGAGFLFGLTEGFIVVSVGSVLGATSAFLVGRTVARAWISKKVGEKPKFQAVDKAVGERGLYIVLLTRLSPVFPFTLLNYFYGITAVSLKDYVLGSWIGMIPGTLMYVYFGSIVKNLTDLTASGASQGSSATMVVFWIGLAATVVVAVVVTRIARRALNEVIVKEDEQAVHV